MSHGSPSLRPMEPHMNPTHLTRASLASPCRRGGVLTVLVVIAALAAAAWQSGVLNGLFEGETEVTIEGAEVRKGDLRISEVVRGNLEASDSVSIKCEIEGRSTIIYLAEEGTFLNEGDLVVELDVSQLADELVSQEIEVKNAEAAYTKAHEQYDVQVRLPRGDARPEELVAPVWDVAKNEIRGKLEEELLRRGTRQGASLPTPYPSVSGR